MDNVQIAEIFKNTAKLLEIKGDNPFKVRAYERAAFNIENLLVDLSVFIRDKRLQSIPGIGKDLALKIEEIVNTKKLKFYEELKKEIPRGLLLMLEIPGLGPKTVRAVYEKLKIDSISKLKDAALSGKLRDIEGVKGKTEDNIIKGIGFIEKAAEFTPLYFALSTAQVFQRALKSFNVTEKVELTGSLRRRKDIVRDIDILVSSGKPREVMDAFVNIKGVKKVLAKGQTKSSVLAGERNIQVDLRVVKKESFGAALMYFTGSLQFNIRLRRLAQKSGYKINEYGVFSVTDTGEEEKKVAGRSEEGIFKLFNLQIIPPQLREDRGEIEVARKKNIPQLIELEDIRGDFHTHSCYSDGSASIEDIARAAIKLGYEYIAITDHSQSLKAARGLSKEAVDKKIKEIERVHRKYSKIRVLSGTEVEILSGGNLDYPDTVLKRFDVVIASIHSGFKQSRKELTKRIIAACKNKYVHIIGHPTGRLIGSRPAYDIDLDEIIKAARDYNTALEINCYPARMDLNDLNSLRAKQYGVKLSLGTDAHIITQLSMMELGLSVAQRGWLGKRDVLNCMRLEELIKWLKR